ncbi:MAG: exonuclease domain-containing protein [Pseudomonadota bacterium]
MASTSQSETKGPESLSLPGIAPLAAGAEHTRTSAHKGSTAKELPTFYYHTHFLEMLEFVERHYGHVLCAPERNFIRDFYALSFNAQCLYVRLLNRRGRLFPRQRLRYAEIGQLEQALEELRSRDFLVCPGVDCTAELLHLMTREQILEALRPKLPALKSRFKKAELVAVARELASMDLLFTWLPTEHIVMQGRYDESRFLLFLFFGHIQDGLTQFTMRDLGLVRASESSGEYEPRFAEREDAEHAYFFAQRLDRLQRDPGEAADLFGELAQWPTPEAQLAANFRDYLSLQLGKQLESRPEAALEVYGRGESVTCSERIVRLLLSSGRRAEAKEFLERCIEAPSCDEEALLASDLYERKFHKKRTSTLTDQLRAAAIIDIDDAFRGAPENAAVKWFEGRGQSAFRVENGLWRTFFGLLFWDLLFQANDATTHSPFDRVPSTLRERRFLKDNKARIDQRLDLLSDVGATRRFLLRVSVTHFNTPNGLFRWHAGVLEALQAFVEIAPSDAMQGFLRKMCTDYIDMRHGYPDLLVIDEDRARFIEVKADGDQLRRNQLLRLEQLRHSGFEAEVLRVRWVLDPAQAYVVVDVETTGGRGEQHRVTEIGAVKVVNGAVVDTFETLLNPQRSIPPSITRLTGISPEMVADAPMFEDIADALAAFLEDAIFVAHNVEFDYRFIGQEFRRLGRPFRMPKLCTCASMRKLYPGHKSYGLASLTEAYDIPLKRHHRALCDAEAAAQLLLMINQRREETLQDGR